MVTAALALAACGTPRPVLGPEGHVESAAEADIDACLDQSGEPRDAWSQLGIVLGTVLGFAAAGAGQGATLPGEDDEVGSQAAGGAAIGGAIGLAVGVYIVTSDNRRYKRSVETCLREQGREPAGWR